MQTGAFIASRNTLGVSMLATVILALSLASCEEDSKPRAGQQVCPIDQPLVLNFRIKDALFDIEQGPWRVLVDAPTNLGCYVGLVIYVGKSFPTACREGAHATAKGSAYCSLCNGDPNFVILRATEISCS